MPFNVKKKLSNAKAFVGKALAKVTKRSVKAPKPKHDSHASKSSSKGFMPGAGSTLGGLAGGMFGPAGGIAGSKIGDWLGKVTGLGDYEINKNTILSADPPMVSNTKSGVRIKHREYIQDVASSILFNNQLQLSINPGLYSSFPWLSGVAQQFTQYKFHGLIYEFITTSGNAISGTNSALGEVMMATNYNAVDVQFYNKQEMLNEEFSCSGVPSKNLIHPIECAPGQTSVPIMYTRTGAQPANTDIRLYDLGEFQLAVQGQQVGTGAGGSTSITLGELYCSYDVEFLKPQLDAFTGFDNLGAHYTLGTVSATNNFGTTRVSKFDSIGLTWLNNSFTIPEGYVGNYMLRVNYLGTNTGSSVAPSFSVGNSVNVAILAIQLNDTSYDAGSNDASSTICQYCLTFSIINPGVPSIVAMTASSGTYPTTQLACDAFLVQLPLGMTT